MDTPVAETLKAREQNHFNVVYVEDGADLTWLRSPSASSANPADDQ